MNPAQEREEAPAMPVRMLNEFAYCPRLFHLEWVQGEFADNAFTVEGRLSHRRVDREQGKLPEPEQPKPFVTRSVELTSEKLGLSAKIDVVEGDGEGAVPIDYKRGAPPDNPERSYEPERVQLCAYGLLLREHGFHCERGYLYFVAAKTKVEIPFDDALVQRTLALLAEARAVASRSRPPAPLVDSPKCNGCSLAGICLPDEVNRLTLEVEQGDDVVRPVVTERDQASPLYVQQQGARVGLSGDVLEVHQKRELIASARLFETSQVVVYGNVQVSTQALRELCDRGMPVCWLSYGGWFYGITDGLGHKNVELRRAQFHAAESPDAALYLARRFVSCKVANCRTLLRRNHADPSPITLDAMSELIERAGAARSMGELLGIEGNAARHYFEAFPGLLRPPDAGAGALTFDFASRNRRPPKDPVNALLSFGYALLAKDFAVTARAVGMDPYLGFYHQPRYGRPALALDLMEEFRPLIVDSVVLSVVNTGVIQLKDFVRSSLGVALTGEGRKRFLKAYERRMQEEVTHPVFGYRVSYRRVLEVQCRLLARHLQGELPEYPEFKTR